MVADKIYSPEILKEKAKNSNITKLNRGIDNKIFNYNICKHHQYSLQQY